MVECKDHITYGSSVSNQELNIIAKQSGILVCRYYMKTHVLESLHEASDTRFGISVMQENIPDFAVENKIVSEDTSEEYLRFYDMMLKGIPCGCVNVKLMVDSLEYRWYRADYSLIYDDSNEPLYALITFFDNTKEREMELASEKWRANLSSVLADAIVYAEVNLTKNTVERLDFADLKLDVLSQVRNLEDVIEYGVVNCQVDKNTQIEYKNFFKRNRLLGLFSEGVHKDSFDYSIISSDGQLMLRRANIDMIKYPHSDDVMIIISFTNLNDLQRELKHLSHKALCDSLTGLLNREGIEKRAAEILGKFDHKLTTAMFIIDLDDFKQVNDRLGHQVGDKLLKQVSETLKSTFSTTDAVGRIGGDEFMVLVSGQLSDGFLEKKAMEIIKAISLNVEKHKQIHVSASIGLAFGNARLSFEKLYHMADIALYTAKKSGKCRFHIVNADTNEEQTYLATTNGSSLMSLQSLFEYADQANIIKTKTPYEAIVENMPGGVVVIEIDDSLKVTHCNDWACKLLGFSLEELEDIQKSNPMGIIHPDDAPKIERMICDMKNGVDNIVTTYRARHKDGHYLHISMTASMTERSINKVIFYGVQSNVSELIHIQQDLECSRKRTEALMNAIPGGIAMFEIRGNVLTTTHYTNWVYEYTGYTREEADRLRDGEQLQTVWDDDIPFIQTQLKNIKNGQNLCRMIIRLKHKAGGFRWFQIWCSVIERTDEKITLYAIYTAFEDATDR